MMRGADTSPPPPPTECVTRQTPTGRGLKEYMLIDSVNKYVLRPQLNVETNYIRGL